MQRSLYSENNNNSLPESESQDNPTLLSYLASKDETFKSMLSSEAGPNALIEYIFQNNEAIKNLNPAKIAYVLVDSVKLEPGKNTQTDIDLLASTQSLATPNPSFFNTSLEDVSSLTDMYWNLQQILLDLNQIKRYRRAKKHLLAT